MSWDESWSFCGSLGGVLAAMESDEDWYHMHDEVKKVAGGTWHWLGGGGPEACGGGSEGKRSGREDRHGARHKITRQVTVC